MNGITVSTVYRWKPHINLACQTGLSLLRILLTHKSSTYIQHTHNEDDSSKGTGTRLLQLRREKENLGYIRKTIRKTCDH